MRQMTCMKTTRKMMKEAMVRVFMRLEARSGSTTHTHLSTAISRVSSPDENMKPR
jgi:hypothetical protein